MLPTRFAVAVVAAAALLLVQPSLAENDTTPPDNPRQQRQQPAATLDNAPSQESLQAAIAAELPAYWAVTALRIVASVNEGDAVEPLVKQRFEADATPAAALFIADTDTPAVFDPFVALIPTEPETRTRTLYGIATSTYRVGTWRTEITLENNVDNLGEPRALFDQPTFILGSDEEAELADRLKANRVRGLRAELERARQMVFEEHAEATESLRKQQIAERDSMAREHAERLRTLDSTHDEDVADLRAAQDQELTDFRAKHSQVMQRLQQEQAQLRFRVKAGLPALRDKLEQEEQDVRAQHQQAIERLSADKQNTLRELSDALAVAQESHEQEMAASKAAHQEAMEALAEQQTEAVARQEQEIAEREENHATRLDELQRDQARLEQAQQSEIEQLQQEHAESLESLTAEMQETEAVQKRELERLRKAYGQEITALMDELGATEERIALQEQLERKREELAARETDAVTAETQRVSALLAHFREQAQNADPGIRREIFIASMESEQASLRKQAIVAALDDTDASVRQAAVEKALNSDDASVRQEAIAKALTSGDWNLQQPALIAALQHVGTLTILSDEGDDQGVHHLQLEVDQRGHLSGGRIDPRGYEYNIDVGSVSRPGISWSDSYSNWNCSAELRLTESASLRGQMQCGRDVHPISANIF